MKSRIVTLAATALLLLLAIWMFPSHRALGQQSTVTDDNLAQAIANAKTPAEHEAIAEYYDKEAAENEAKAKLHLSAARSYEAFKSMKPVGMATHCQNLAKAFEKAAEQDKMLAAAHRAMAKEAGQGKG